VHWYSSTMPAASTYRSAGTGFGVRLCLRRVFGLGRGQRGQRLALKTQAPQPPVVEVEQDAVKPGVEGRAPLEAADAAAELQEGGLAEVLGLALVAQQIAGGAEQPRAVFRHRLLDLLAPVQTHAAALRPVALFAYLSATGAGNVHGHAGGNGPLPGLEWGDMLAAWINRRCASVSGELAPAAIRWSGCGGCGRGW